VALSRSKKRLERTLKALECKINLIIKVVKMINKTSSLSVNTITTELKNIIEYQAVVNEIKDESLKSLQTLRDKLETSTNTIIDSLAGASNSNINKIALSIPLPDKLPEIGSGITVFGIGYKVKTATVSNLILNITGDAV
jgi:hypothetical protein